MSKLLSIVILVLSLLLFPPATLALISNNAVPGDATYPIKRALEDGIYAIVALHPTTKAWFSAARSDRRFKELTILLSQGKQARQTLSELVIQTEVAANQIAQIKNQGQKEQLISQLSKSIAKYDESLKEVSKNLQSPAPTTTPTPQPIVASPHPTTTPRPTIFPSPKETPTPQPSLIPSPTPLPTPSPSPIPQPSQNDIDQAREELEKIKKKLEKAKKKVQKEDQENDEKGKDQDKKKDRKEDKDDNRSGKNKDRKEKED